VPTINDTGMPSERDALHQEVVNDVGPCDDIPSGQPSWSRVIESGVGSQEGQLAGDGGEGTARNVVVGGRPSKRISTLRQRRFSLAMKMAMIGTLNAAMKSHGTARSPRFLGVFGGTEGLIKRLENR
jgi:hypothetical protein